MKESYDKSIQLQCITCGDVNFEFNEDKSWVKCKRCGKEYSGGYNELVELNQAMISHEVDMIKDEFVNDMKDDLREALNGN